MTRVIEITVTADGKTTVATSGFVGPSCRDASKFIEQALGQQIGEQRTAEFYHAPSVERQQQQRM